MQVAIDTSVLPNLPNARIAILQSKWYRAEVDAMVEACVKVLASKQITDVQRHILPGSLELPLAAKSICLSRHRPDAIICFGAILQGETKHFDMVMDMCTRGLSDVMLECNVPIIVEVLPITHLDQLRARAKDDEFNKGIEAAAAAIEIIDWRAKLNA